MALIQCPECGTEVSTQAKACPKCGYPVAEKVAAEQSANPEGGATSTVQPLAEIRQSWWGYFWYLFFFFLIVPPIIAWMRRASIVVRIYPDRISVERGLLSKCYQDYNPKDIRSIDVDQSVFGRLVNVGDLTLSTAATVEASEELRAIPDPLGVRDLILAQRGAK
jgi:uncharacterized membrane protein YdbT with pleckstrin-like domain